MREVIHDRTKGYIYFISDGEAVKIGWSKNVIRRMAALQTSRLVPLALLGTVVGSQPEEFMMHNRFHHLRLRGEWFKMDLAITKYLADLRRRNLVIDYDQHYIEYRVTRTRKGYHKDLERLASQ